LVSSSFGSPTSLTLSSHFVTHFKLSLRIIQSFTRASKRLATFPRYQTLATLTSSSPSLPPAPSLPPPIHHPRARPDMTTSSPLASTSYYKRPLPSSCLPFNSPEGRRIFANLQQDDLDAYFLLSQHFLTQNEPAYCALGTLAMILNSLEMDPQRIWKGNWRWYSENLLDCCRPLEEVAQVGLTLPEFACLARCNGLSARVVSPPLVETDRKTALEEFRRDLKKATRAEEIMAISYSRKVLGQTGTGHFSPVGAYSPSDDKLLVLDVAR